MTTYYDGWMHKIHLGVMRSAQFTLLSVILGSLAWYLLLTQDFDLPFLENSRLAFSGEDIMLRALLDLCMLIGALLTACLFIWLMRGRGLRGGERHHRGAHIQSDYSRD